MKVQHATVDAREVSLCGLYRVRMNDEEIDVVKMERIGKQVHVVGDAWLNVYQFLSHVFVNQF